MQPFGPNRSLFMSYSGKLARNGIRLPLTYVSFLDVHKDILDYIWREVQQESERNKKNRQLCSPIHCTGRNSCANIRREMAIAGKHTDNASVWIEMRTDATDNPKDDTAAAIIEAFDEALEDVPVDEQDSDEVRNQIFEGVMGSKGHGHGRVRTMGLGPTPSQLKAKQDAHAARAELEAPYEERLRKMEEDCNSQSDEYAQRMKAYDDQLATMRTEIELMRSTLPQARTQAFNA